MSSELPQWLVRIQTVQKRTELRHKLSKVLLLLNGGSPSVKVLGFNVDVLTEFDRRIGQVTDRQVAEILEVLRE